MMNLETHAPSNRRSSKSDESFYSRKVEISCALIISARYTSYMTFIIKEAWEYFSLRAPDGVMVYNLRKVNNEKQFLKDKISNLQKTFVNRVAVCTNFDMLSIPTNSTNNIF
jgi:hypothetical protein